MFGHACMQCLSQPVCTIHSSNIGKQRQVYVLSPELTTLFGTYPIAFQCSPLRRLDNCLDFICDRLSARRRLQKALSCTVLETEVTSVGELLTLVKYVIILLTIDVNV
jgi:hypothetical protein